MPPTTDSVRHEARLARRIQMDGALGAPPRVGAECSKVLGKAPGEIAQGLDQVRTAD